LEYRESAGAKQVDLGSGALACGDGGRKWPKVADELGDGGLVLDHRVADPN
jgi:hypothetical protein